MPRTLGHLRQRPLRKKWLALGLLLATFVMLVLGISAAVSGIDFSLLWPTTFLGLVLGWTLAATSISGFLAAVLGLLLGPLFIVIQVGNLSAPLADLAGSSLNLLRQMMSSGSVPTTTSLATAWSELAVAADSLVTRLYDWLAALVQGRPLVDPVATAILWLLVLWMVAYWAGWSQRRLTKPMLALLPGLLLLAAILATTGASVLYLAPAMALTLILQATTAHAVREEDWRAERIDFTRRPGRSVAQSATGLALALMLVVLITPSPSIYRLVDMARDLSQQQRDQELARSLGLEVSPGARSKDTFAKQRFGGLPARHLIGSGPELSQKQIMAITVEHSAVPTGRQRYWRGVTYDRYDGRGWESRGTTTIDYRAGEIAGRILEKQHLVRQEVRPLTDLGRLLYAAGTLTTADKPFQVAWRARYRGTETYTDIFAAAADESEGVYRADSVVPVFDEAELRGASTNIPEWIAEYYLVLPAHVSERVRALARDLTAVEPTPYDRAAAIERYLRQFPYTLDLPAPPTDREIAEYFLFELQRGYCDYYATTMVVLARAAGLPARLVTGYIGGAFDEEEHRYTVTADLAHSWPEIYFPDHGWIPFEPTSGRPAIERPAELQLHAEPQPERELEPITATRDRARLNLIVRIIAGVLLLGAAIIVGWWLLDTWRLHYLTPERTITQLFERLSRSGRWLDVRPKLGETPLEFAARLSAQVGALSNRGAAEKSLSSAPEAIDLLAGLYTRTLFSPYEPHANQRRQAIRAWSRLRVQLIWATLLIRGKGALRRRLGRQSRSFIYK